MENQTIEIGEMEHRGRILIVDMNPTWSRPVLEIAQGLFGGQNKIEDYKNLIVNKINSPKLIEDEKPGSLRQTKESTIDFPNIDNIAGIVMTGSPFSGALFKRDLIELDIDREGKGVFLPHWQKRLVEGIKEAREKRKAFLGICFGSQQITEALGGKIEMMERDKNGERRKRVGYKRIYKTLDAEKDPLFKSLPNSFVVIENRDRDIIKVPEGATVLALDEDGNVVAFRIDKNIWGMMFYPEKTAKDAEKLLEKPENQGKFDPLEQDKLRPEFDQSFGQQILQNFTKQAFLNTY